MATRHEYGLEWLRDIRRKMAEKFDHDPKKAAAHYQEMQRRYSDRLCHGEPNAMVVREKH